MEGLAESMQISTEYKEIKSLLWLIQTYNNQEHLLTKKLLMNPNTNSYTPSPQNQAQKLQQPGVTPPGWQGGHNHLQNQHLHQKNKADRAMYSSTIENVRPSQNLSILETMGRFVKEDPKEIHSISTNIQPIVFSGMQFKQPRRSEFTETADKSRPSNFTPANKPQLNNAVTHGTTSFTPTNQSYQPTSKPQPPKAEEQPETPAEKKKREIMEIKRELDELNKKMAQQVSKKENINIATVSQEPHQHPETNRHGIAHSMIMPSNEQSKNNLSLFDLYAQKEEKKGEQRKPQNYEVPSFQPSQKPTKMDSYIPSYDKPAAKLDNYTPSYKEPKKDNFISSYKTETISPKKQAPKYSANEYTVNAKKDTNSMLSPVYPSTSVAQGDSDNSFKKKKVNPYIEDTATSTGYKNVNFESTQPSFAKSYEATQASFSKTDDFSFKKTKETEVPSKAKPVERNFKRSDFIVGKKLGKGQFGEVMMVQHKLTGFICAMKVMNKKEIRDQKYEHQIARELSIQAYLSHRNICPLYGYFADQENFYILIEFCVGGQLLSMLRQVRRMQQKPVTLIMKQISQGIDYIHKQLIIHRDIKPQNILFNFGVAKICDFGWAVYKGHGMRKTASGSPLYYSPEIVMGTEYDEKIDIWCIGMMTYECILGKIPFRIYTEMDLNRIVEDDIVFPEYVDTTEEARDFILKTCRKKPEERMDIKDMFRHPLYKKYTEDKLPIEIMQDIKKIIT